MFRKVCLVKVCKTVAAQVGKAIIAELSYDPMFSLLKRGRQDSNLHELIFGQLLYLDVCKLCT